MGGSCLVPYSCRVLVEGAWGCGSWDAAMLVETTNFENQEMVVQHINATVNLCKAATQNTTCVHNCRMPFVFCLILVVCVQCLLRIVALISQHPVLPVGSWCFDMPYLVCDNMHSVVIHTKGECELLYSGQNVCSFQIDLHGEYI